MFIKTTTFRRMLKEAFKTGCLRLAQLEDGTLVINTGYQVLNVQTDKLLPPEKACIIEFAGELPEPGEAFLCKEGGNQMEVFGSLHEWSFLKEKWMQASDNYKETYIICDWKGTLSRAVQHTTSNGVLWYQEEFMRMIVNKPSRPDEEFSRDMRVLNGICMFRSNYMTIGIWPVELKHTRLNHLLENLELWKQEHEYDD